MASRSWNRVELIGNLTRDPELRYTPTGSAVCTFTIATNRTFISEGEKKEEADFHKIVAWAKLGELCSQLLKKGNRVFVSGRLQNRSWSGQDGQQRQSTEIVIEDMILLTTKSGGDYAENSYSTAAESVKSVESVKSEDQIKSEDSDSGGAPASQNEAELPVESHSDTNNSGSTDSTDPADSTDTKSAPAADEKLADKELDDLPF